MDGFDDAFFREAKSGIRALNDGLLAVENGDGDVSVDEMFRVAHSLKGTCRTQGLPEAGELAHALEDVLGALRSDEVEPTTTLIDESLAVVDCLEAVVRARANGDDLERDVDASLESLRATLDQQRVQTESDDAPAEGRSLEPTSDDEWNPAESELSDDVVAALEETTEFDDLDALLDEDGEESDEELDSWGLLDEDATPDGEETDGPPDSTETSDSIETSDSTEMQDCGGTEGTPDGAGKPDGAETPDDPSAFFEETKSELDEAGAVDALQEDIDAVEFGEFDDDDNYTIDELLDLDPDESPPRDGDDSPDEAEDAAEVEEEEDDSIVEKDAESAVASDRLPADRPSPEPPASQSSPDSPTDSSDSDGSITPPDSSEGTDPDEVTASASDETTGPTSDGTTASTPVESSASADGDATNEFVFGGSQEDASDSRAGFGDEIGESRDETADPDEAAEAGGDQTGGAGESATEATSASVPDPDSVPDSVPDADLDVELSGDLDVGSDDEWDDSGMDVSVDEEMAEFESRFGDLLGGGPGEETAGDGPTFRAAVSTIEESRLDADDFPTAAATPDPEGPGEFDRLQETTVDVETADQLLNVAEELSLTHLRLDEAVGPETDEAISEEVANLRRVVTEYRRTVMDVRLVPLQTAVDSVPRTVRDVARSQDKDVELVLEDADVELDRSIIDELRDPLVHVARNAVDHGIESPDDRVAAGKPPEGTIEIRAERVGDRVVIEVSDDGRGIDPEAVRQRAVDTGVLTRKEAKRLDDEEVYDLLFEPGFTTREEVTDVSGRGVGMDVVSRTVADLDGSVTVESVPGEGTTVRLTVPVSIVFTEVLFVETNRETFGIPMSVVEQITATPEIRTEDGREVVRQSDLDAIGGLPDDEKIGDETADHAKGDDRMADDAETEEAESDHAKEEDTYSLIRLASALDLQEGTDTGQEPARADGQIVWVREEDESLAIRCDRVVTSREVVVRPYGDLLRDVPGVSGATTLGDGEAVNVLDVGSI